MELTQAKKNFEALFSSVDGYNLSYKAKKNLYYTDKTLTYGEILFDSFYEILKVVTPQPGEIFYDLGSGTGKAVFSASLLFPFSKSTGIEVLEEVNNVANDLLAKFNNEFKTSLPPEKQTQTIQFIRANFFDYNFSDADIIFFHATCHPDELMIPFSKKCERLKKGARVIIVTRTLSSDNFHLLKTQEYPMGWGKAIVNFYEKII